MTEYSELTQSSNVRSMAPVLLRKNGHCRHFKIMWVLEAEIITDINTDTEQFLNKIL